MAKQPHVLLFNPDQWRGDTLGHLGHPAVQTPELDRVVREDGVSITGAYCQNPVCTPSRCSFMTGWYPHVRGHRTMHHMLRPDEPMLLRTLKRNGYYVWWGGKNDIVQPQHGFADYCDVKFAAAARTIYPNCDPNWRGEPPPVGDNFYSFYIGKLTKPAQNPVYLDDDWEPVYGLLDFLKNPPRDKPLCIFLALGYPHPPYCAEEPYYGMTDRGKVPPRVPTPTAEQWSRKPSMVRGIFERQRLQNWTEARWAELRATYYDMCARVDHQFGLIREAMERAGLWDDTAMFCFSDHGDFTGDYGLVEKNQNTFEDCLTRVPLIVRPPKGVAVKPGVRDALAELIDVSATVEALTGVGPEHDHFGKSLLPVVAGTAEEHRDAVFCEGGRLRGERQAMELDSRQTPATLYWPRVGLQMGDGPESTKAVMCRTRDYKYVRRLYEKDELYDLRRDPHELDNRIDDPALAAVLARMKERTLTFFMETGDAVPRATDPRYI